MQEGIVDIKGVEMTRWYYSNPKMKEVFGARLREHFNFVKTMSTPDLLIKVFVYKPKVHSDDSFRSGRWRGHYRNVYIHGFYSNEVKHYKQSKGKIRHVIQLKFDEDITDRSLIELLAHEYRHYWQFKKYKNPKEHMQLERDAKKFQRLKLKRWLQKQEIKVV